MQNLFEWLVAQWMARFAEINLTMGDLQMQMRVDPAEQSVPQEELLWWEQPFSCSPENPVWIGCAEDTWTEIGKIILAAAGVDPAPATEIRSTYLEIVGQSMGSLAQDIGNRISAEVSSGKGVEEPPKSVPQKCFKVETDLPNGTAVFYLVIPEGLCQNLAAASAAAAAVPVVSETKKEQALEPTTQGPPESRTFELLLDVELPVSVSFGRTVLKLQDAMKLITGSLIELNRNVTDPVELLVNNSVIARGDVVVVDGNYGVRITEIISHQERLQQSRRYLLQ
jgi:flagellar motor switch protein FliN/FliY